MALKGNGDGLMPIGTQTVGGLIIETPLTVVAPAQGGSINLLNHGSTTFSDVTLILSNLNANRQCQRVFRPGESAIGGGTFKLQSTSQGVGGPVDLLVGTIASGNVSGNPKFRFGSVLSGDVTYTGGLILNALNSALGKAAGTPAAGGSLSFSLLDIDNKLTISTATSKLNDFTANATGQFGTPVVPEPPRFRFWPSAPAVSCSVAASNIELNNDLTVHSPIATFASGGAFCLAFFTQTSFFTVRPADNP